MASDQKKPIIMLIGLGSLGSAVLELLAREREIGHIIVCSRNAERGIARCNVARLGAVAQGYAPSIRFAALDLNHRDQVTEAVAHAAPDIILNTATMQAWWRLDLLPPEAARPLTKARFGVWLAPNLTLTLKLMQALRAANYAGLTVTAPFPDVVNCILGKFGLAAECGVGNLDEIAAKVRLLAAEKLGTSLHQTRVVLVAHHALEAAAFGESIDRIPPYFLRVYCGGEDVTAKIDARALLLAKCPLPSSPARSFLTAGSMIRLVRVLVSGGETLMHAPSPHGLPGGYPVIVRRGSVECAPIEGLSQAEAVAINERSHAFDGIERIESDGTAIFCAEDARILRQTLGYACDRLSPGEVEPRAQELIT
ncbi:MAG: saccharopine dehydrogenase NADP-binding domain-containing protein, partial [Terriglobia bacterium]